jgi:hypothetical protein
MENIAKILETASNALDQLQKIGVLKVEIKFTVTIEGLYNFHKAKGEIEKAQVKETNLPILIELVQEGSEND